MHGLDGHASSNLAMVSLSLAGRSHFEEARAHLGLNLNVNGHRAIVHHPCATCPVLNRDRRCSSAASCSIRLSCQKQRYQKTLPTFADALALVRQLWQMQTFQMSSADVDTVKVPRALFNTWSDLLCYAA